MRLARIFIYITLCCLFSTTSFARVIANIPNTTTPLPPTMKPIQVQSHKVNTVIKNGVAVTTLETVFHNPNYRVLEGTYLFALPKGATVSEFSLWIDGKEMPAELLDAKKARDLYISIVRKMIDPALLEFVGRETFKMRIFPLPANGSRQIKLSYQQILPADGNLMRYEYPITVVGNGREDSIQQLSVNINIESEIPIKSVFSPTHKVKITKEDKKATVSFSGNHVATDKDFVLYISNSNKKIDLSFIPFAKEGEKGYFLMMLSPKAEVDPKDINPKDVVFVLDTSGSMIGDKMDQAKKALQYCLHQLRSEDKFNIVPFSTEANPYKDNLMIASKANIKNALGYVEEEIRARGGTNIEEALKYALEMSPKTPERPFMVILLTDGKPTIGVTDAQQIIDKVKKNSTQNLRIFTFGIGEQLDTKLLDRLAEANRGVREYVSPKEDIEIKISSFVDKISSPVLSNIKVSFPSSDALRVNEVYPRQFPDLFKGSRLTILGRYKGKGDQAIRVNGVVAGKEQEFVYEVSFPEKNTDNKYIPRLWSVRKVGFLLDQIRLHGENDELKKEVVRLAKKFGIVTPYTSYLVVEDTITNTPGGVIRPTEPQNSNVWRGGAAPEDDAEQTSEESVDGDAFDAKSGSDAVKASKEFRDMKNADGIYETEKREKGKNGKLSNTKSNLRKISYKTFYKNNKVWRDSESTGKAAKKMKKVRIEYLSNEYIKLIQSEPDIAQFLAIGSNVVVVWKGKIYEIYTKKQK